MRRNVLVGGGVIRLFSTVLFLLGCLIIGTGSYYGSITIIEKEVIVEKKVPEIITKDINNYKQVLIISNDTVNLFIDVGFKKNELVIYFNLNESKSKNGLVIIEPHPWENLYKSYSDWKLKKSKIVSINK